MKVRWTTGSVRFRITPQELQSLVDGRPVECELAVPGGAWKALISPECATAIAMRDGCLIFSVSEVDLAHLADIETEGVYCHSAEPPIRYFVEKDFPCVHPRTDLHFDPPTETF